jgi:hypothetical protein
LSGLPAVRKYVVQVETIYHDGGPIADQPLRRAVCAAVLPNPFARRFEPELISWMDSLQPLSVDISNRLLGALQAKPEQIEAFGKGAMVGVEGEHEHAAVWHAPGGAGMKSVLNVKGFVSAGETMGAIGDRLHIPLVHVNSPWVRSHFDSVDICIADAPRPWEIVFALAMSTGPRIHQRLGGLTVAQVKAGEGPPF